MRKINNKFWMLLKNPIFIAFLLIPYTNISFNLIFNTYKDLTYVTFYMRIFVCCLFVLFMIKEKNFFYTVNKIKIVVAIFLFLFFRYISTLINIGFSVRELFFLLSDSILVLYLTCIIQINKQIFIKSFFWLITIILLLSLFFEFAFPEKIMKTTHVQSSFLGIFKNRNNVQFMIFPYIYILICLFKDNVTRYRFIYFILLVISIIILINTRSLTTIISFICSIIFGLIVLFFKKKNINFDSKYLLIIYLLSAILIIFSINNIHFFEKLTYEYPRLQSLLDRIIIWDDSIKGLNNHWIFGIGSTGAIIGTENILMEAHNSLIGLIQTSGILGLLSIIKAFDLSLDSLDVKSDYCYIILFFSYVIIGLTECVFSTSNICMWFILLVQSDKLLEN